MTRRELFARATTAVPLVALSGWEFNLKSPDPQTYPVAEEFPVLIGGVEIRLIALRAALGEEKPGIDKQGRYWKRYVCNGLIAHDRYGNTYWHGPERDDNSSWEKC